MSKARRREAALTPDELREVERRRELVKARLRVSPRDEVEPIEIDPDNAPMSDDELAALRPAHEVHPELVAQRLHVPEMADYNSFQRVGSPHNSDVGRAFEEAVREHFLRDGIILDRNLAVPVGIGPKKRLHHFDLGSERSKILIECKSHVWTIGGNVQNAKMTVWNEAMYYFYVAPLEYKKMLFVLKHERNGQSLASYYVRTHGHLIPDGVEVWELDVETKVERQLK